MKKLQPKRITIITTVMVFVICLGLIVIRWASIFSPDIFVINQEINSHISNFTLSVLGCVLVGYLLLSAGKSFKSNLIIGLLMILANLVYETVLPILNTIDFIDAIYGIVGVCLSMIYLYIIHKYGFKVRD